MPAPRWGPGLVVLRHETGWYHHIVSRYVDVDDGTVLYEIADSTHTRQQYVPEREAVRNYESAGFRLPPAVKPAEAFGERVEGILYGYKDRPHVPVEGKETPIKVGDAADDNDAGNGRQPAVRGPRPDHFPHSVMGCDGQFHYDEADGRYRCLNCDAQRPFYAWQADPPQ
ncbi:hypothetical protein ACFQDD_01970 [Halorubrum pallidum]|uniref:Uncharacterized protein n=1 Tax=Halorubrum pallidum TaxID=1526114 RepID=A0ABD5SZJ1_9EURY